MAGFCLFPHNSAASIGYYLAYRNIDAELKEIRWYAEFVRLPQDSGVPAKTAGITVRQWSRRRSKRSMMVAGDERRLPSRTKASGWHEGQAGSLYRWGNPSPVLGLYVFNQWPVFSCFKQFRRPEPTNSISGCIIKTIIMTISIKTI
jgi:hypothetical protein